MKQKGFQVLSEDREWPCRGDVGWQFAPRVGTGDRECPFVDCIDCSRKPTTDLSLCRLDHRRGHTGEV